MDKLSQKNNVGQEKFLWRKIRGPNLINKINKKWRKIKNQKKKKKKSHGFKGNISISIF